MRKTYRDSKCNAKDIDRIVYEIKRLNLGAFPSPALLESYEEVCPGISRILAQMILQNVQRQKELDRVYSYRSSIVIQVMNYLAFAAGLAFIFMSIIAYKIANSVLIMLFTSILGLTFTVMMYYLFKRIFFLDGKLHVIPMFYKDKQNWDFGSGVVLKKDNIRK
ncbi:Putative conserved hypothetical protein [Candidatus Fokinia solitaria]|uniref:Uncharacterized protein n=1 Tax=Candidatus Fokinia solitaria TaxID=1802984 RepID=A0A2U8BSX5_9RICK|nr:hypothetical protein [Candidatus Fokinia solitaria]AWD33466.1 Putative conserved hypothetical protein [Candidatus Fokinia solitaria]